MLKLLWALPFALFSCKGQPMTGAEIAALLPGRVLIEGAAGPTTKGRDWHYWTAEGLTFARGVLLNAAGHWEVKGDRYCQIMGIQEEPICYRVFRRPGPDGLTLHFDGFLGWTGYLMPEGTPLP